ncbi:MAG TPA: cytochrome c biogenesis heme-transporting ATPase CcmA [Gammaproteobacteria bacterium]|nr:cytochrome c biogenesis heme-transporting ATPase CcmA [Gammaproteobacteria bacterium]
MNSANKPVFAAAGLHCVRGDRELFSGLSFELRQGDILHISGANGSGKTSLLRILAGLHEPAAGAVYWEGLAIAEARSQFLRNVQYIGHLGGIKMELSPLENMRAFAALALQPATVVTESIVERLGLAGFEYEPAYRLSSGQRRRIALSRLLLSPARLWILDEPFTALDARGSELLVRMVDEQLQRGGMVAFASHSHTDLFPGHIQARNIRLLA